VPPTAILGIPDVDAELAAWLPPGWVGLLEGGSGSGLPLLAKQYAQAARERSPVLYYTTYERTADVQKAFDDFGWDAGHVQIVNLAEEYYERVLRRDLEVSRNRDRGLTLKDLQAEPPTAPRRSYNITGRVLSDLAALEQPFRMVIDSLDFFLEIVEPGEAMTMVRQIRHRVQALGGEVLLLVQAESHARRTIGLLEDLADLVVELRAEARVDSFAHLLAVKKVRNHPERTSIRVARMSAHGLVVPPRVELPPAPTREPERER